MQKLKAAFIGLGVMGYPMAGHCARAGFEMTVYNRTSTKAADWVKQFDGQSQPTPAKAVEGADFIMVCVGNDDDVRSVFYSDDGLLNNLTDGAVVIDHTTTSVELAKELALAVAEKGGHFIDAPVSGGQAGAENGQLSIMAGGEQAAFERASVVFEVHGKSWQLMGEAGSGQACKMVNQVAIAGIIQGLAEGLALAKKEGLNIAQVQQVLSGGAAQSWQLDNRALTMAKDEYDFGFAIDWMIKDLGYCLEAADAHGLKLPVASQVKGYYQELASQGMGRCDTSVLLRRFNEKAAK